MAKFYIQLENQRLPIGEITREEVLAALGIDELFNFTGNFYDLDDNPFSNGANGEFNIVDEEGRIIAIVDEEGIHSIEMTAEDKSGTVHKLTDKMDRSNFDEIISTDGNNFIIQDEDGNQGFVLTAEGATAHDFITYKGDSLLDIADRVESVESNVGSIDNMISATGNEFIIQDDKANPNVGLKLNSEGLFVKDVTLNNGEHVLSQKADKTYVDDVKSDMTTELENKINSLDATVSASGRTHGVKVSVTQTNGKLSSVSVDDSKIDFTKLTSNPIDVNEESQSFVIKDISGNKGFVLNSEGAKAKDFTTSTGVSLNGLNTTVVSIRTEVDNINNMISAEEEGSLIIRDNSGNVGLKLDKDGLRVQDVYTGDGVHQLSNKADKIDVDDINERLEVVEKFFDEGNEEFIDNLNDVIDFFKDVKETDTGVALLTTVATHEKNIEKNASNITTLSTIVSSNKEEIDASITTLSTLISSNASNINKNASDIEDVNNRIDSLTTETAIRGVGDYYGVIVAVSQSEGLITSVSVNDSGINFNNLAENPITVSSDNISIDDYSLTLTSDGLSVKEVKTNSGHRLSNKADVSYVDTKISGLTRLVSGSGDAYNITVEVKQDKGVITEVSVIDNGINFNNLNNNPIEDTGDYFIIKGDEDNIGLKLDSEGLHVQDVYTGNRVHQLSLKADIEYVNDLVDDVNDKIDALTTTVSHTGSNGVTVAVSQYQGKIKSVSVSGNVDFEKLSNNPITVASDKLEISLNDTVLTTISSDGISTEKKMRAKEGFYQTSDETLKVFHDDIEVNFNTLNSIPKMYYTWKGDNVKQIGTSAQKVQEIYPELVSLNEQTGKLSLDYAKLSIIALKAIDLLHEENESLKLEIETLHNEMDKIKSHLGL